MPTVILLDVSLSMSKPLSENNSTQCRHLAHRGINVLLDHIGTRSKLEFVSLIIFSSLWENKVPFTRDYDLIRSELPLLENYDKTAIPNALRGLSELVSEEWGANIPCNVVLITDGSVGLGESSIKTLLGEIKSGDKSTLPFQFLGNLCIMCMCSQDDRSKDTFLPLYHELIAANNCRGKVYVPDGTLDSANVEKMFQLLAKEQFEPFTGTLQCGNLKCPVQLYPGIDSYQGEKAEDEEVIPSGLIEVCGFLGVNDVASPPFYSRHLVLPTVPSGSNSDKEVKKEDEEDELNKQPTLTVLLHGSLKIGSQVALVELGPDWYGLLYSWADNKKKANLMLSVFTPGLSTIAWLGNLQMLGPAADLPPEARPPHVKLFPITETEKKSYSQNCVVWIKPSNLQADIQKVLRNARKLPEKQQQFYKELNRVRKAAVSYSFFELFNYMAQLLDRECTQLPGNSHPEAAMQLRHASDALRSPEAYVFDTTIQPLQTNFQITRR